MDEYDFDVIAEAGLTQQDYADLVGVSRVTANKHINRLRQPKPERSKRVRAVLRLIRMRLDEGRLPLELPTARRDGRKERRARLLEALR